jgi:hypothetical protein
MRYLLHSKSIFSKLGLFENLRKLLQLYAEKHKEMSSGKIQNVERCETFQSEEPVKPLNSKMQ